MESLNRFLTDQQDPKIVGKIYSKVKDLLIAGETIDYIAVQKKPAVNLSPDCVALTNKRIIFCRPRNLGFSMDFQDYIWRDVEDCHMKEEIFGAKFSMRSVKGVVSEIDYLPKVQARKLYQIAQEQEEQQQEIRRQRDLEERRAVAGGVTITSTIPNPSSNNTTGQEDPLAVLQKLKTLFENGLITQDEFDAKKADILSRL